MSTITCSLLNGEEITIDLSENATPEKVVKSYFQTKRGWDEREIEVRFISENNYCVILDTFSDKFIRTCSVEKTKTIADKNKVQTELRDFIQKEQIQKLDVSAIYERFQIQTIGDAAFCGCSALASVTLPEGLTTIGDYAFRNCSKLTSVTLPEGLTTIERSALNERLRKEQRLANAHLHSRHFLIFVNTTS